MALILSGDTGVPASGMPTGSVIQVVQGTYSTATTTSSTSFVTTGLSASITPKFSTSKILVTYSSTFYNGAGNRGLRIQITRAGTSIYAPNTYNMYAGSTNLVSQQSLNYLDSPATTSAITYQINFACPEGGSITAQYDSNTATIILMEVQG
jgi:hypothetical protein